MSSSGRPQTPQIPTMAQLTEQVIAQKALIEQLQAAMKEPTQLQMQAGTIAVQEKAPAIKSPDTFDGTRSKLESFLSSIDLYITFNTNLFSNHSLRVVYAITFLRGPAFQ